MRLSDKLNLRAEQLKDDVTKKAAERIAARMRANGHVQTGEMVRSFEIVGSDGDYDITGIDYTVQEDKRHPFVRRSIDEAMR